MWPGLSLVLGYGTMGGKNCAFSPTLTSPIALCGLRTVREVLLEWTVLELALPSRPCLSCPIDPGLLSCHPVQTGGTWVRASYRPLRMSAGVFISMSLR